VKKLAVLTFGLISAMPAPAPAAADNASAYNPNEVICRTVRATGSRIASSRRCATRAQWAEDDRMQREAIRSAQTRQTQPSCMSVSERMSASGRYASSALGGSGATCQ
jgi:hypothetical protein